MLIGPHIVVYDDDRVTALGLAAVLGDAGYDNIETTSSSKIALAAIEQWDPIDLLVSDIVVPNGRQISPTASSIYVTGYASGPKERAMGWPILPKRFATRCLLRR